MIQQKSEKQDSAKIRNAQEKKMLHFLSQKQQLHVADDLKKNNIPFHGWVVSAQRQTHGFDLRLPNIRVIDRNHGLKRTARPSTQLTFAARRPPAGAALCFSVSGAFPLVLDVLVQLCKG